MFVVRTCRLVMVVALIAMGVYVALDNTGHVLLKIPAIDQPLHVRMFMALFGAFLVGVLLAVFFFGYDWGKKSLYIRKINRKLRSLETLATHDDAFAESTAQTDSSSPN